MCCPLQTTIKNYKTTTIFKTTEKTTKNYKQLRTKTKELEAAGKQKKTKATIGFTSNGPVKPKKTLEKHKKPNPPGLVCWISI